MRFWLVIVGEVMDWMWLGDDLKERKKERKNWLGTK